MAVKVIVLNFLRGGSSVCVCVRVRVRQSSSSVSILGILNLRVEGHLWLTNWHKETKSEFILIKFRVVSEKSE